MRVKHAAAAKKPRQDSSPDFTQHLRELADGHSEIINGHQEMTDAHKEIIPGLVEMTDAHSEIADPRPETTDPLSEIINRHSEMTDAHPTAVPDQSRNPCSRLRDQNENLRQLSCPVHRCPSMLPFSRNQHRRAGWAGQSRRPTTDNMDRRK